MTQRQREHGVEALFRVLSSGGHSTITQLRTDGMKALPGLFSSYVGLDSEDRHYINQAIMLLLGRVSRTDFDQTCAKALPQADFPAI